MALQRDFSIKLGRRNSIHPLVKRQLFIKSARVQQMHGECIYCMHPRINSGPLEPQIQSSEFFHGSESSTRLVLTQSVRRTQKKCILDLVASL